MVLAHLKKAGYTKKLDIWVPHELTERNLMNRVLICDSLLRRNETEPFLKKLITGDEKWITYDKNVRKRSWSKAGQASQTVAKPGLTRNKVMLCVWWDWKGIIHYELLPYILLSYPCRNGERIQFPAARRPVVRGDKTTHSQVVGHLSDWMATTPGLKHVAITTLSCVPALVTRFQSPLREQQRICSHFGVANVHRRW
ncbi:hypothetical protein K1T71_001213 [Dendrolimus kikuchii]|uniref:Uncharacterized protein n=1 Tax=Dendrolimus kikuchii TaxID=765133 RepID=A0ACC1DHZ9_9NEOP|nr:hypothetical protein K1T71_001213 [Dendrolimus kikuchii]